MTDLLDLVINAVFTGLGTGIGSYLSTRYAVAHLQRFEARWQTRLDTEKKKRASSTEEQP